MATIALLWCFIPVVFLGSGVGGDGIGMTGARRPAAGDLTRVYQSEIGVRETTGKNDGPRIAEYLRYCGLGEGYEWCAAFVSWCYGQAGYGQPKNAWAAALFPASRTVRHPRKGDVFGIYIASKKRIGHCGFVDGWDGKYCLTVEGNVDNTVVRKRRLVKTIHAVARWL